MLNFLPNGLKGCLYFVFMLLNTVFWLPVLLIGAFLKIIIPLPAVQKTTTQLSIAAATNWVSLNSALLTLFNKIDWHIEGGADLSRKQWYLVNCNHQSWADILIVQKVLNRKVPMLKFFLKQELIWVPIIGVCWWALDFPFMKRYSAEQVRNNPSLAGKDLETTRKACEKFKSTPVSVFNFLEGTRFTPEKHQQQQSPFSHLLKPKAGGAAFVLGSMGKQMHTMLDISLVYPEGGNIGFWDLLSGNIKRVSINIRQIDIPAEFLGKDYASDAQFKAAFQQWLNELWVEKDALIDEMKQIDATRQA